MWAKQADEELDRHHVLVRTDDAFQRRARLRQALWREERGLPIGQHGGRPLGSRLAMPAASEALSNYLSDTIRAVVHREVCDPARSAGKLYAKPRIWNDLLSSQPLCFNLFGELQADLDLASRVFSRLMPGRVGRVTAVGFEHSPGRGDERYTGDRSAFDVFVEHTDVRGAPAFVGIEVKYHEGLGDPPAPHRERYDSVAAAMACFRPEARERLMAKPLQQIWRDHLLAGALGLDREQGYASARFAFLSPRENARCASAVERYRACLASDDSFVAWTLEQVVDAIQAEGAAAWIGEVGRRYLGRGRSEG